MKRNKIVCPDCGQEISKSNFTKHQRRHQDHPETFEIPKFKLDHDGLECKFCGKSCKNRNSLCNHERQCNQNPDKQVIYRAGFNDFGRTAWNKGLTKDTSKSVLKHSESLKEFFKSNPDHNCGGFKPGSVSNYKFGVFNNMYCDSSWELAFLVYCRDHSIQVMRNQEGFKYEFEGKSHKYYPDFIIDDTYYEIKSRCRAIDLVKIRELSKIHSIILIDEVSIRPYLKYCEQTYGKNFAEYLYDSNFPSWVSTRKNKNAGVADR